MVRLSLKKKILLLSLLPLMTIVGVILIVVNLQLRELGNKELQELELNLITSKQEELKGYIDMSLSAIQHIYESAGPNDEKAQQAALQILTNLKYGEKGDGYILAYEYDGTNLAIRPKPQLVGKNLYDLKDSNGVYIVRELIEAGKKGGGFVKYVWDKPSKNHQKVPKLTYSDKLDKWNWIIATGFYIDDVDDQLIEAKQNIDSKINQFMSIVTIIGLAFVGVTTFVSLWFANSLANPLAEVASTLREIGQGDGDLSKRLDTKAQGEVGELAIGFNSFVEKMI